jgi:hypothetical protein
LILRKEVPVPLPLDPEEREYWQQRTETARHQLQTFAPRGTTLFLRAREDPKFESPRFWLVEVTFLYQGERINFNEYLKEILAAAEQRVIDGTPTHILSWISDGPDMGEAIARHLGTVVWNDPDAYMYQWKEAGIDERSR